VVTVVLFSRGDADGVFADHGAFATGLAEAGVNVQHAMHLTAHSDPKVHERYLMNTEAMQQIPVAALPPTLPSTMFRQKKQPATIASAESVFFSRATQESNLRPSASETDALSS
jgi:hypothetical protein